VAAPNQNVVPFEPGAAEYGPAMKALPNDKYRAFVYALYTVPPGRGANVKAAKLAGFGTATSSAQNWATIACRIAHDERVLAAIHEEDGKRIRASAPRAIHALNRLIEDPSHKDHARAIATVLDRVHPVETSHVVKVEHQAAPSMVATAEVMARMMELARGVGVDLAKLPPMIDAKPVRNSEPAP
jgi:hypothetical protein